MEIKDIYERLLEKCPKKKRNIHYLNRYVKFIELCLEDNKNIKSNEYMENHHIFPKSKTLWPEYKSFNECSWNKAILTPRQHFIAHWMLSKAFGGAMWCALSRMTKKPKHIKQDNIKITSTLYDKMQREKAIHLSNINRIIREPTDKEIILAYIENYNFGLPKETSSIRWVNDGKIEVMVNYSLIPDWINEGRLPKMKEINKKNSSNVKGKIWVNDGKLSMMVNYNETDHKDLNKGRLKFKTPNRDVKGNKNNAYGKKWYTDGTNSILILEKDAPDGYYKGMSDNYKNKVSQKGKNLKIYNNGEREIRIPLGDEIPSGYIKGRVKHQCMHSLW